MRSSLWRTISQVSPRRLVERPASSRSVLSKDALLLCASCPQPRLDGTPSRVGKLICRKCSSTLVPHTSFTCCISRCSPREVERDKKRERGTGRAMGSANALAMKCGHDQKYESNSWLGHGMEWNSFPISIRHHFRWSGWTKPLPFWCLRRQLRLDFNRWRMASNVPSLSVVKQIKENSCTMSDKDPGAGNWTVEQEVRHCMQSLEALPGRHSPAYKEEWVLVTGLLLDVAVHLSPKNIAIVLNRCKKARYMNDKLLEELVLCAQRRTLISMFNEWQLAESIHALGVLERDRKKGITWSTGPDGVGRSQSAVLKIFALNLVEESAKCHRLEQFESRQLVNIIYGTILLNINVKDAQICIFKEAARQRHLHVFKAADLVMVVWSWGRLRYCDKGTFPLLMEEVLRPERLQRFREHELSTILHGLAIVSTELDVCYTQQDRSRVCGELVAEIQRPERLALYSHRSLAIMIWALGKLQYAQGTILAALMEEVLKRKTLARFDAACLSNLLCGLASLERQLDSCFRDRSISTMVATLVGEAARPERQAQCNTQNRANIAWALAELRFIDERFLRGLLPGSMSLGHQGSPVEYRMLLHACATFNTHDDVFLAHFTEWMMANVKCLKRPWETTSVLLDMSILGALDGVLFHRLVLHLCSLLGACGHMDAGCCSQLFFSWLHMSTCHQDMQLNTAVRDMVEKAREKHLRLNTGISNFHHQVSAALVALNVKHDCDVIVDDSIHADIVLDESCGRRIIIEVDGPSHYTINRQNSAYQLLGSTLFRNKLLEKWGWQVMSVPFFEWYFKSPDARKDWLREWLANGLTPKAY